MIKKANKGFTLIEILIVVAIIAILASVVLVGLGPTQEAGRDARRISDLSEIQNGLELYYNKYGIYPGSAAGAAGSPGSSWAALSGDVTGAGIGITAAFPNDPSANMNYNYWYPSGNAHYVIGAHLENANNSVFTSYNAPAVASDTAILSSKAPADCGGSGAANDGNYCTGL